MSEVSLPFLTEQTERTLLDMDFSKMTSPPFTNAYSTGKGSTCISKRTGFPALKIDSAGVNNGIQEIIFFFGFPKNWDKYPIGFDIEWAGQDWIDRDLSSNQTIQKLYFILVLEGHSSIFPFTGRYLGKIFHRVIGPEWRLIESDGSTEFVIVKDPLLYNGPEVGQDSYDEWQDFGLSLTWHKTKVEFDLANKKYKRLEHNFRSFDVSTHSLYPDTTNYERAGIHFGFMLYDMGAGAARRSLWVRKYRIYQVI